MVEQDKSGITAPLAKDVVEGVEKGGTIAEDIAAVSATVTVKSLYAILGSVFLSSTAHFCYQWRQDFQHFIYFFFGCIFA